MKSVFYLLLCSIPFLTVAQQPNLSGIWKLKERKNISGPEYGNGVPKSIIIRQSEKAVDLEIYTSYNDKDTVEFESLKIGPDQVNEFISETKRKSRSTFIWNSAKGVWKKEKVLSAKGDSGKQEIVINELYALSPSGDVLILTKSYDGADLPGGNQDYTMEGIYEKSTAKDIVMANATGKGVIFTEGLTWVQILEKAKKENKYIFVDCYATWCAPCKKMDKEVFTLNRIGEALNEKFVSLKVQVDTGKNDNYYVKLTYPTARMLEKEYSIKALPTYLFFDPSGNIVHKEVGSFSADEFAGVIRNAQNPDTQLYTLYKKAKTGQLPHSEITRFAKELSRKDRKLSREFARMYFDQYLSTAEEAVFYEKQNIEFFSDFLAVVSSNDRIFKAFLKNTRKVDSLSGRNDGSTSDMIVWIIESEEIVPFLEDAEKKKSIPKWDLIEKKISRKYGKTYSYKSIVNMKVFWYRKMKMWEPFCDNLEKQIDLLGDYHNAHWHNLNSWAWNMFEHSDKKSQLEKALKWSEASIEKMLDDQEFEKMEHRNGTWAQFLDTYANLLYKLGRTEEAIKYYQNKVLAVAPKDQISQSWYLDIFAKIKAGQKTWPEDE